MPIALPQIIVDGVRVIPDILLSLERLYGTLVIAFPIEGKAFQRSNGGVVWIFGEERLHDGDGPVVVCLRDENIHRFCHHRLIHRLQCQRLAVIP